MTELIAFRVMNNMNNSPVVSIYLDGTLDLHGHELEPAARRFWEIVASHAEPLYRFAIQQEREACARLVEEHGLYLGRFYRAVDPARTAALIRARGESG